MPCCVIHSSSLSLSLHFFNRLLVLQGKRRLHSASLGRHGPHITKEFHTVKRIGEVLIRVENEGVWLISLVGDVHVRLCF
jgi:hypothetical protein